MNNISLLYFIAAAEELNITKAAARLFITQQSLSEHIRKLEKHYNAVFFERSPRLRLTYQGEHMLAYAKRVVEAEQTLIDTLQEDRTNSRVRLSIGQTSSRVAVFMPTIFRNYHRMYPNVVLSILNGSRDFIDNQLRMGKIEMYLGLTDHAGFRDSGEILYQDKLYFIISHELLSATLGSEAKGFIQAHRNGVSMADACRFPLSMPPSTSRLRAVFDAVLTQQLLTPNTILETSEHDVIFDVCQAGLCGCFVSRELLYRKMMHKNFPPNLIYFPAVGVGKLSCFDIVYNEATISPHALAFLNCCRDTVKKSIVEIEKYLTDFSSINP